MCEEYTLYFAYGSNLDRAQMEARCPSAVLIGPGVLRGYRLAFSGYSAARRGGVANVRRSSKSDRVPGLIWEISSEDLADLDVYEGYPQQYTRKRRKIRNSRGKACTCWVYQMTGRRRDNRPGMSYYALIAAAYTLHGFSVRRLTDAMLRARPPKKKKRTKKPAETPYLEPMSESDYEQLASWLRDFQLQEKN